MAKKVLKKKNYGQLKPGVKKVSIPKYKADTLKPVKSPVKSPVMKPGVQPVKRPSQYQPVNPMKPISKIGSPKAPSTPKDSLRMRDPYKNPITPSMPVRQPASAINIPSEMKKLVPEDMKKKAAKAKRSQRRVSLY